MSQRVDAGKFIAEILSSKENPRLHLVLTDNLLIRRLTAERLKRIYGARAVLHSGKSPVQGAVEAISTGDLFGEPAPIWIELPEKISSKQWGEFATQLCQLSDPPRQELYIFAPASARHGAPETKTLPWLAVASLIYEPNRSESLAILASAVTRFGGNVAHAAKSQLQQWCAHAFDYYSGDLEACDLHFERMANGNLNFDSALVPKTNLDAFDFIEAFSGGDLNIIHLRMSQLEQTGEETGSILSAFAYTARQVLAFQAALAKLGSSRAAHDAVKTPYPSQARIERLSKLVSPDKWAAFFLSAAELERHCRNHRNAHSWLAVELTGLLN